MIKKILKIVVILIFVVFLGIQFIRPNRINPVINESEKLQSTTDIPAKINNILKRSCNDCHTNETVYPWYSNIAPISWKVVEHIEEGREELNFSVWKTYEKNKQLRKLEEICEEVSEGEMPLDQYLYIHWDAELSEQEKKSLCQWTKDLTDEINKNE